MPKMRNLVLVLGDQLDLESAAFDGIDARRDLVWMAELAGEATYVPSHKVRIAFFLSAMRHFAAEVRARKYRLEYRELDADANSGDLKAELQSSLKKSAPEKIIAVEPGEYRIQEMVKSVAAECGIALEIREDRHFLCSQKEFAVWAEEHKQLRMEFFYREMRRRSGVLMEKGRPVDGRWNFDVENRKTFSKTGPGLLLSEPHIFQPDRMTREVITLVNRKFPKHPGTLDKFDLPVSRADARIAVEDFVNRRLPEFGRFQDAMWTSEPYLYHSRLSGLLNVKLLNPRTAVAAAQDAYYDGHAPLSSVEGFIRQIIGWREYIRGVYWTYMPDYIRKNALGATEPLPDFYWSGDTDMNCLRHAIGQTLEYGYAHHIQRLMVTGLYALLFGVDPIEVNKWYLAIYWDAVEWVEMPNVIGMSQYADGGLMGSKPYIASGKYIDRMSNYCAGCRYQPDQAIGERACPFTTLYWDFLMRHEELLSANQRTYLQVKNLARLTNQEKKEIQKHAEELRSKTVKGGYELTV
ncbi:MAG: cryptochrome/photolyase family protein [Acidobacteriaceae bacterium]|nr:cryptochrome/photolyase family protein [Acidobacteriaceae bacterium]